MLKNRSFLLIICDATDFFSTFAGYCETKATKIQIKKLKAYEKETTFSSIELAIITIGGDSTKCDHRPEEW